MLSKDYLNRVKEQTQALQAMTNAYEELCGDPGLMQTTDEAGGLGKATHNALRAASVHLGHEITWVKRAGDMTPVRAYHKDVWKYVKELT